MRSKILILAAACALPIATEARADVVDNAYWLCQRLSATGLTTECDVHGWGKTVDVRLDMSSSEARKSCAAVSDMTYKAKRTFAGAWKLRFFSPYSGEHPTAVCNLR